MLIDITGNASLLRELSVEKNLKIDVNRSNGVVALVADKYKCFEVAEDIERLLNVVYSVEYDLKPFKTPQRTTSSSEFSQQLSVIAERCRCAIEEDWSGNKVFKFSRKPMNKLG